MSDLSILRSVKVAGNSRKTAYSSYEEGRYKALASVITRIIQNPEADLGEVLDEEQLQTAQLLVDTMPLCRNPTLVGAAIKVMMVDEADNLDNPEKFPAPKPREWAAVNAKLRSACKAAGLTAEQLTDLFGETYQAKKGKKSWAK